MGRRQRRRYREQTAQPPVRPPAAAPAAESQVSPEVISDEPQVADDDADYAAYLASLGDDSQHAEFLDSLDEDVEQPPDKRWSWPKEKITWNRYRNLHDTLRCRCGTCISFRKVNGIAQYDGADLWADEHPGEPDPWDDADLRGDTDT